VRTFAQVVRADFLERVRRHGFYMTLAVTLWFAYVFLPPNGAKYVTLEIAGHRGLYGSAWVGSAVAMLGAVFLSLAGFYLVKNAVERDRRTGVGAILATTPMPTPLYTFGKAASNFAVLATMALLLAAGAGGMQWLRGEDRHVDVLALLAPFVVVTLPALAVVAALAVVFESVRWLRGGLGNVAYFFLWTSMIATAEAGGHFTFTGIGDFLGTHALLPSMAHAVAAVTPGLDVAHAPYNMGFNFESKSVRSLATFAWAGPQWTAHVLLARAAWAVIGATLAVAAAIPFDRFDTPAPVARARRPRRGDATPAAAAPVARREASAHDLPPVTRGGGAWALVRAELRLALAPMPWAWSAVAAALALACVFVPLPIARTWLLPAAWIWPLLVWSPLGARDVLHRTEALLDVAPRPLLRPLAAQWAAGAIVSAGMGAGVGARLLATGHPAAALAWLGGALFVPTAALACGTWTGNGRLFEILYLMLWYIGPLNHFAALDYAATQDAALAAGAPLRFAVATLLLAALTVAGRARRLAR
jgi:hypothetical protein